MALEASVRNDSDGELLSEASSNCKQQTANNNKNAAHQAVVNIL